MRTPLALLACALVASGAGAQEIHGTVADQATGLPVTAAVVVLADGHGRALDRVVADSAGAFALDPAAAGEYTLSASAPGYRTVTSRLVQVGYGERVDVALVLAVDAIPLQPLLVKGRSHPPSRYLETMGFYRRQRVGIGTFLTRDEIMRDRPDRLSDVLREVPGLSVAEPAPGPTAWVLSGRGGGRCQPALVLDGTPTLVGGRDPGRGRDIPMDEAVSPAEIDGMEIYLGPGAVPGTLNLTDTSCGVIVVWTRRK